MVCLSRLLSNQNEPYTWRRKYSLGSSRSGKVAPAPEFFHCQSSDSTKNGSQLAPLSTETKLSPGKRSHTPERTTSAMARALPMNRSVLSLTKVCFSLATFFWYCRCSSVLLAANPMWKLSVRSHSWMAASSGSQCESPTEGSCTAEKSLPKITPRCPSLAARWTSLTDASRSQNGSHITGIRRSVSMLQKSTRKSL